MCSKTSHPRFFHGWQGAGLVAVTYVYFLIFAQFGFLKRLAVLGIDGREFEAVMAAMAGGGIAASLLASRLEGRAAPGRRLQGAFAVCAAAAALTLPPLGFAGAMAVALLIGAGLGLLTVTLVTHLALWLPGGSPVLKIGWGVGLAYLTVNFPPLFEASPAAIALVSASLCFAGMLLADFAAPVMETQITPARPGPAATFPRALTWFTALVWLDSAAFFIIQSTPSLKSATWGGGRRLWLVGGTHWLAALGAVALISRCGLPAALAAAFTFLGGACLLFLDPARASWATVVYPVGVSLYSVALVAYPAFLAPASSPVRRARAAGWLYAVAGWTGSALGIGMARDLHRVPPLFVAVSASLLLFPVFWRFFQRRRFEIQSTAVILAVAWVSWRFGPRSEAAAAGARPLSIVEQGREVYIAEGCIHCHSQFTRPVLSDSRIWGAPTGVEDSRGQSPPLIGNRRQGPDLAAVGGRRSALWLKMHFVSPRAISYNSPMPSYARLFADDRGNALVAYALSLGSNQPPARLAPADTAGRADRAEGEAGAEALLERHCATCHAPGGSARRAWGVAFRRPPPDLVTGPFIFAPAAASLAWRVGRIAEIIEFGLPGTDMPGHEYLSAAEVWSMARKIAGRPSSERRP